MPQAVDPQDVREKALSAQGKEAALGEDINLSQYVLPERNAAARDISQDDKAKMLEVGIDLDDRMSKTGTFVQIDNIPVEHIVEQEGIEVTALSEAMGKYSWLRGYYWSAVPVDADKYTAHVELNQGDGYFIRAGKGCKTEYPVQSCLYLRRRGGVQDVHNIIIAEEGSELHIITGCTVAHQEPGLHLGVTEIYVKKGARVTFTMIHSWSQQTSVRPRTGVIIEEGGIYVSNYINLRPTGSLQQYPTARCQGQKSTARFNSILLAPEGTSLDVGARALLEGEGSRAELITRAITTGGEIISRGFIGGHAEQARGHLECRGLILAKSGIIHAIPEIEGTIAGVELSHEAAIGKIAEEEVEYLMARGLSRDEATAAIIRGFLRIDIEGLPTVLIDEINHAISLTQQGT